MQLPNLSFILGLLALLYLSTFVLFAVVRVATGVSIQRLGLSSLRRISYVPREGLRIDIRGLGLQIHRPTFSQPTWISIVLIELKITLDLERLGAPATNATPEHDPVEEQPNFNGVAQQPFDTRSRDKDSLRSSDKGRVKAWARLLEIKNKVKKLHRILPWIRLIDLVAHKSTLVVAEVGSIHIGTCLVSVDTRRQTIDHSRLFLNSPAKSDRMRPAEWMISLRSVLLVPQDKDSIELTDHCVTNIHGFLHPHLEGLRDASIFVKVGRLHIPYDEIINSSKYIKAIVSRRKPTSQPLPQIKIHDTSAGTPVERQTNSEQDVFFALADAKDFIASVLRGIREVSLAVSTLGLSKCLDSVKPSGSPVYLSLSLKELGLDIYKLDPTTPAHSMYFSRNDIAHQGLLSAISLAVGIDDRNDQPDRLLYIPMTTATVKTTLPSKLLQFAQHDDPTDRNTNVFFSNLVITSPSIDVDSHHLPKILALAEYQQRRPSSPASMARRGHTFVSQLLPRAEIKLSIQEPVVRVALPTIEPPQVDSFPFDLLISNSSALSIEIESSHDSRNSSQYLLSSKLRLSSHKLYYQTALKRRHDLLNLDGIELRTNLSANPDVKVTATGNFQTLSMFMVRSEINDGIRQIVQQARSGRQQEKFQQPVRAENTNVLRKLPPWLESFSLQASDFNFEIAGVDKRLSSLPRGFALHLESWTIEYKSQKDDRPQSSSKRRRGSTSRMESSRTPSPPASLQTRANPSDGRRLAIHVRGLESFIIESANTWEQDPFIALLRAEVALTTTNDGHGPVLHVNSLVRSVYLQYSLFKHYCVGVAVTMLRKTFIQTPSTQSKSPTSPKLQKSTPTWSRDSSSGLHKEDVNSLQSREFVVVDFKTIFLQLKANLPTDPKMMLHLYEFEVARHRWLNPHARAHVARLYTEAPAIPGAWNRVVSLKAPRLDLREGRRAHGPGSTSEKSFDFVSDAIRIGIPSQLVVHRVFDNMVNSAKVIAQLHHRFKTQSDTYILAKHPEAPKNVPRISVRSHLLFFELEDHAFEWKLGVIFRAGLVEQKQRLAREQAFSMKRQRIRGQTQSSGLHRPSKARGANSPSRNLGSAHTRNSDENEEDTQEIDLLGDRPSTSHGEKEARGRAMRYNCAGFAGFSAATNINEEDAWKRLQKFNSQSWKTRIDRAMSTQHGQMRDMRSLLWGLDSVPEDTYHNETVLQIPTRPGLMTVLMSDVNITLDKPSFQLDECQDFMHSVGKGLPKETEFALLIPLNANFELGECRMTLRDYPLPLMHIPAIKPGQSPRLPSWSVRTDFVIAEEFRDFRSTRDLQVIVVPASKLEEGRGGFAVDVRRTVSPVKMYSDIKIEIHTARDTRFTWGTSYQAAIQDMMQVIEGFTKPQVDPSERVGFWDKIRLSFHSRINVAWKGDGDVHLMLKGSRDPYVVTGFGAGFVMVWRNDVRWNIWQENDPCKFMTVDSGDYVLAVPDFNHYARQSPEMVPDQAHSGSSFSSTGEGAIFKKVIMKLSGKVRWQVGLVFERNLPNGSRSFDFAPHYNVTLRNPLHVKALKDQEPYDAFSGFRSHHIHMSIGISAPSDRDWSNPTLLPSNNYNAVHLTPRFFTHFFAWWGMFSGNMSLPIHQGSLFPGIEKSGKKFGRHLATIKYNLLLSPFFISHVYKHKDPEEYTEMKDEVAATGLKCRLDNFVLDIHQRREEFTSEVKGLNKMVKTSGMRIYQTLLDLVAADIRAVSASITGTSLEAVSRASTAKLAEYGEAATKPAELSAFTIPDHDFSWIDVDDLVEIDWTLPTDSDPQTKILPLAFAPKFSYRRHTDHYNTIQGDPMRNSPFGYEDTHPCVLSGKDDSRQVQMDLIQSRLDTIDELIANHSRDVGEHELRNVRDNGDKASLEAKLKELQGHGGILEEKHDFLHGLLEDLNLRMNAQDPRLVANAEALGYRYPKDHGLKASEDPDWDSRSDLEIEEGLVDPSTLADHITDFNNRFVVHNAQIKWNDDLRNIMLRYLHQSSQRRGFIYYTSRRAVKFIIDIVEEQKSKKDMTNNQRESKKHSFVETPQSESDEMEVADRIEQLLSDGKKYVDADDPAGSNTISSNAPAATKKADQDIAHGYVAQNTYHVRLVAPQIQLQSMKNAKAAVLLTCRGMRMKVFQIMDRDRISDEVSGLVQRRFSAEMDSLQFFVTCKQSFGTDYLHMYSSSIYGASPVSRWPPWVPLEVMFDFDVGQFGAHGFSRVVQRTSASLRFDKSNALRLKLNDSVSDENLGTGQQGEDMENAIDHLWIDFPRLRALCDSSEYYAMYIIVLDLLLYNEPLEKKRNERLEKILLASDFSDLRGAPEMITLLQERIRQLEEIKTHFHINEKYLDRKGWQDRISLDQDLAACEDELFFMMKAMTTSQRNTEDRKSNAQSTGLLRYYFSAMEIVWHLTQEANQPLAEFQLGNVTFERTDNSDGSNHSAIQIDKIHGLNLLPNALYPEIVAAYDYPKMPRSDLKMFRVNWHMLEAIAGIPVVDHFEVNLFPLKVQLEYETGRRLFEYVFPGKGNGDQGSSPFIVRHQPSDLIQDEEDEEAELQSKRASMKKAVNSPRFGSGAAGSAAGAGSLELRLQPTHVLPDTKPQPPAPKPDRKGRSGLGLHLSEYDPRKLFTQPNNSRSSDNLTQRAMQNRLSVDSVAARHTPTPNSDTDKRTRFAITTKRPTSTSNDSRSAKDRSNKSDDLTQMLSRASNYTTLAYVKIPSVVLCLSYKGRGARNIEDVHNLVFRMPTLEYRNKTWSNLDLALALKKDIIRALISHTGTIFSNKFSHHKPGRAQQGRLRELASSSVVLSSDRGDAASSFGYASSSSVRGHQASHDESSTADTESASPRHSDVTEDVLQLPSSSYASSSLEPTPESPEIWPEHRRMSMASVGGSSRRHSNAQSQLLNLPRNFSEKIAARARKGMSTGSSPSGLSYRNGHIGGGGKSGHGEKGRDESDYDDQDAGPKEGVTTPTTGSSLSPVRKGALKKFFNKAPGR